MNAKLLSALVLAAVLAPVWSGSALADAQAGKAIYEKSCKGCHGAQGQGVGSFPKLAGLSEAQAAKMLHEYREGEKVGPKTAMMAPAAKRLSDAEVSSVAAFIGTLK